MTRISTNISGLSPKERRALLEQLLSQRSREPRSAPLSLTQERLWLLDQFGTSGSAYNIPHAVGLGGPLSLAALEQSLNELARRHETLRTTFALTGGKPAQVIWPTLTWTLAILDLGSLPQAQRETQARELAIEEAQRPFDLARGPLVRATLLRLDEQDHLLLATLHHIISDGWSMGVWLQELVALYRAFSTGRASTLSDLPIQYADFALWQRDGLPGEALETHLSYWKKQLGGRRPALELPTDRPRPPVQTFRGAMQSLLLSQTLTESIKALSRRHGVTLFMALLAIFKTLLYRYTGQEDLVVGTPIANRNRSEVEGLIGFFANSLVLRSDLSGNPSFRELLDRIREVTLEAYAHQDLPFERLVEALQPQRDLSRNPLFQVSFSLQHTPMPEPKVSGLTLSPQPRHNGCAKFDLHLSLEDRGPTLTAAVEYNTDLFAAGTMARMLGHFRTLLEGTAANPEQQLSELPLLTDAERQQLLIDWNDVRREYPHDLCIHEIFQTQVNRSPDAVAAVFETEQVTYQELNRRANKLAHYLRALGVGPEVLVGVCLVRSLEMIIGLLGILKAGGAYVPLDPAYPKERLSFMVEDTQVATVITHHQLAEGLPEHRARLVCLPDDWEKISQQPEENPRSEVTTQNLAYVIYTSGSTGQPKGAMLPHHGVRNRLLWGITDYDLGEGDRVLNKTPLSFDVSVWEIFAPLLAGSRLVIARPGGQQDRAYLVRLIAEQNVTHIDFVPSMLQVFLEEPGIEAGNGLKLVTCAGETLTMELQERFFSLLAARMYNLYGPTEASLAVTFWVCQRDGFQRPIPIGRPMTNIQIYLLDRHLQPVPVGVPAELYIGGVAPGRGYLNRPGTTAERFIPDPFSRASGARLYKTGDLARYWPDGQIEFLGRLDHQVKIRGYRVELGEIEAALEPHPALRDVLVMAREDIPGDQRLVVYAVSHQQPPPSTSELRSFLKQRLPEYLVPSAFVLLQTMPLTGNGKVDRQALPAPESARPQLEAAYVAPRTDIERTIATLWQQVLQVEQAGVDDNFFDLGGNSLLLVRIHSQLRDILDREVSMIDLFNHPTIRSLARHLTQDQAEPASFQSSRDRAQVRRAAARRRRSLNRH